ncbi:MAG TPA: hypothetical protein QF353_05725 [Gammaproteobacteria bacterium]|nr:hypothetical protein [Gammaproteobacteria bacterium]
MEDWVNRKKKYCEHLIKNIFGFEEEFGDFTNDSIEDIRPVSIMHLSADLRNYIGGFLVNMTDKTNFLFKTMRSWVELSLLTGSLDLSIYHEGIPKVIENRLLVKLRALQTLKLGPVDPLIGRNLRLNLAAQCQYLRNLSLNDQVTDKYIKDVMELVLYPESLTKLNLRSCTQITNDGLKALVKHCKNLTELNLPVCLKITDEGIVALAKNCKKLRSLDVSYSKITDDGLKALVKHCKNLTELNLRSCAQITDKGLKIVVKEFPGMQNLTHELDRIKQDEEASVGGQAEGESAASASCSGGCGGGASA